MLLQGLDFSVYTGATEARKTGLHEKEVLTLGKSIKGRNHQVYFDNYFTSISLLAKLLSQPIFMNVASTLASPDDITTIDRRQK